MKAKELFLNSTLTESNDFIDTTGVLNWIRKRNNAIKVDIKQIPFDQLQNWYFDKEIGALRHSTGKFFSIEGINVTTNWGKVKTWSQPVINQPEIGYLGIITKVINGVLYFLLQAKIEPGNVNNVQLSPTLQATKSNYQQVHKGKAPRYLEYFQNVKPHQILLDQLQSEQGARFLRKRNRNIIINVEEDIPVHEDFIWLTLGQIKKLITYDNIVNMDTRTVISGIPFDYKSSEEILILNLMPSQKLKLKMLKSAIDESYALYEFDEILNWLTALKCKYELEIKPVSIFEIRDWKVGVDEISHVDNKYFKIIAAKVSISNREVQEWTQPLVKPLQEGITAFIVKEINNVDHFLVQAKLECGNFDILEIAPTVQCITDSYNDSKDVPFLDLVLNAKEEDVLYDTLQSEEGGRFFREQNRNLIIKVGDEFPINVPPNYFWVTLKQLNTFLKFNNYLNIQARSIISVINFI